MLVIAKLSIARCRNMHDHFTVRGKLDGLADEVQQDQTQSRGISARHRMQILVKFASELDSFCYRYRCQQGEYFFSEQIRLEYSRHNLDGTRVNF